MKENLEAYNSCKCGSSDFEAKVECIDIFRIVEGKMVYLDSESFDFEYPLYCRNCYEAFPLDEELEII